MYKGFVRTINSEFIVPKLRDKGGLLYGGFRIEAITGTRIKRVIIIHPSRAAVPSLPPRSSNDSTPKRPGAKSTYTNRVYIVIKFVSKPNYIERTAREEKKGRKKKKMPRNRNNKYIQYEWRRDRVDDFFYIRV
jgi:hypothetical protein